MFLNAESTDGWYLMQNQLDRVTSGGSRKINNGAKMVKTDLSVPLAPHKKVKDCLPEPKFALLVREPFKNVLGGFVR